VGVQDEAGPGAGELVDGRFRVLERLGAGGMGVVYRALQLPLEREVALKLVRADGGAEAKARFLREARVASRLRHPGIGTVHDCGRAPDGVLWLAMELVAGRSLKQVLAADGPLPLARAAAIATQLCDALAAAHAAGVVHRDVKPSNVMVLDGDRVRLLDFGLARSFDGGDTFVTREGVTSGTPAYMAPEVVRGGDASARSDLFALGMTLYEMLAGAHPFAAPTADAMLARILADTPPPLDGVGLHVAALIERLLVRDPTERPGSAVLVKERLLAALEADRGARPFATPRPRPRIGRRVGFAVAAVLVTALAAIGTRALVGARGTRYRGGYWSSGPEGTDCTSGTTWWRVDGHRLSGGARASSGLSFDVAGTVRDDHSAVGEFATGDRTLGSFVARFDGDVVTGTSRDLFGCEGRFRLERVR
jgi:hypothetical protein